MISRAGGSVLGQVGGSLRVPKAEARAGLGLREGVNSGGTGRGLGFRVDGVRA